MLWEGWYELGRAHMKQREWNLGLSALEQARQLSPYVADVYSAMATCYLKMNKKAEARQLVNETLQREPTNAEALRLQKQL
jgi:cytochrome c-type biogenesis protein CcmH/NrfG